MKDKGFLSIFIFVFFLALLPLSAVVVPRFLAYGPGLIGLLFFIWHRFVEGEYPSFSHPAVIIVAVVSAMTLSSSLWAIDFDDALLRALRTTLVLASGLLLLGACQAVDMVRMRPYLWLIPAAILLAAALIFFERTLDGPLFRLVRGTEGAALKLVKPSEFNRPMVAIVLCLFPAAAILKHYIGKLPIRLGLLFAALIPAFFVTGSQSAQLAFIFGFLFLLFFPYERRIAWIGLVVLISGLMFAAPFLATWLFNHYAEAIQNMPIIGRGGGFAGNRLEIWDYVSRYALQKPLLGYGFEASRHIEDFDSGQIFQKGTSILHPHNFVLQVWLEMGIAGVIGAAALTAWFLHFMRDHFSVAQNRVNLPVFIAAFSIGSTGYGMWQGWWLGLLFLVAAFCILATRLEVADSKNLA